MVHRNLKAVLSMVIMLTAALIVLVGIPCSADQTLYVSPSGNDTWSGRSATAAGTDGPLATLNGARLAARKYAGTGAVNIIFAGGRYELTAPVVFEKEDSGAKNAPVVYMAAPGTKPVISGGRRINGFKQRTDGFWEARVPGVAEGKWYFEQLWINGHRATRARTPNTGYLRMAGQAGTGLNPATGKVEDLSRWAIVASPQDFQRISNLTPQELNDVEVTTYSSWETAKHKITALDSADSLIKLSVDNLWAFTMGNVGSPRYHLENYRGALDAPGEWFVGRNGVLLYKPLKGQKIETAIAYAPEVTDFLVFAGDYVAGKTVENIEFRGLTFEHSQYILPKTGHRTGQAEVDVDAVITANNAQNIKFDKCNIQHIGKYAFWFKLGSKDCSITRSLIEDMGAGGVKIGEFGYNADDNALVKRIVVDNNIIRGGGRIQTAGIGVLIGHSPDNQVTHNDISDLYYTCVSVGWSWGYGPSNAVNNKIDFNHLHHIGYGVLSDMGAVYTLGISPGTTVSNNVVHDVNAHQYGGWGLYNDEGSTHITLENNLIYRCGSGGYHQHYGEENHFTNNIIAYCGDFQVIRSRQEEHTSFIFDHNIVLFDTSPLGSNWSNEKYKIDNNLYFNSAGKEFTFAGATFAAWKARGHDVNSIIANPMFRDPARIDFRLKPGSPALKIGFKPFDFNKAGVYGDKAWKALARAYTYPAAEKVKAPPTPKTISNDFENTGVGGYPLSFGTLNTEGKGESVAVTDETAASGKHSLKFIDSAGLSQNYVPHIDIRVTREDSTVLLCDFDVRVEQGSRFWHEWRDWLVDPYIVGPNVRIFDGKLVVNGQPLMDIPSGVWTHFKISCGIGKKATGKWNLAVTVAGQPEQTFNGLKCGMDSFKKITYLNFVAEAEQKAVFYLDNVKFR